MISKVLTFLVAIPLAAAFGAMGIVWESFFAWLIVNDFLAFSLWEVIGFNLVFAILMGTRPSVKREEDPWKLLKSYGNSFLAPPMIWLAYQGLKFTHFAWGWW